MKHTLYIGLLICGLQNSSVTAAPRENSNWYRLLHYKNQLFSILALIGEVQALENAYQEQYSAYHYEIVQTSPEAYQIYLEQWVDKIIKKLWNLELEVLEHSNPHKQKLAESIVQVEINTGLGIISGFQAYAEEQILLAKSAQEKKAAVETSMFLQLLVSSVEWQLWFEAIQEHTTLS